MKPRIALLALALSPLLCRADGLAQKYPPHPGLEAGRQAWLDVCRECHANSLSDAPQVGSKAAWEKRLAQGRAVLLNHALNGFTGPGGGEMPPRGGMPDLSDAQVGGALDYMIRLINP